MSTLLPRYAEVWHRGGMRVDADELELEDPLLEDQGIRHHGLPFTGTRVEREPGSIAETAIVDGSAHGRHVRTSLDGVLLEEAEYARGRLVGERRQWFHDGQLRSHLHVGPPRRQRAWNERGVLVLERDEALKLHRRWTDEGVLRSERVEGVTREFTHGQLAWTRGERSTKDATTFAAYTFVADVMHAHLETLIAEHDREHDVFIWVHSLIAHARPEALDVMRRLLANDSLWIRSTALALAGNAGLTELRADVAAFLGDARIPPREWHGSSGRSASRSLDEVARVTLRQLG